MSGQHGLAGYAGSDNGTRLGLALILDIRVPRSSADGGSDPDQIDTVDGQVEDEDGPAQKVSKTLAMYPIRSVQHDSQDLLDVCGNAHRQSSGFLIGLRKL